MNFQPSNYLSELNLVFDHVDNSPLDESNINANLQFFSQSDFYDLDVFSNDFAARQKQHMSVNLPLQQHQLVNQREHEIIVKQEEAANPTVADGPVNPSAILWNHLSPATPAASTPGNEASDELKRRRNTAASARFRIKKKLKEKQMEQHARDLESRLGHLEKKLRTLELENKCLRQLVVEKTEKKNCDLLESIKKRSLGGGECTDSGRTGMGFTYTN